jgi:Ser-tRNA(Ala) deacylase AlaX
MAEYIERDKVIKALHYNTVEMEQTIAYPSNIGVPEDDIEDIINEIPAADVVEVVRCEKCLFYEEVEYYHPTDKKPTKNVCRLFKRQMQPDDFCSYGKRKDA